LYPPGDHDLAGVDVADEVPVLEPLEHSNLAVEALDVDVVRELVPKHLQRVRLPVPLDLVGDGRRPAP
jgi:hypothetical protein